MRCPALCLVLAALNAGMTCGGAGGEASQTPPLKGSRREISEYARDMVSRQGFTVETFEPADGRIETAWRTQLAPHWKQGRREQVRIRVREEEEGVRAQVEIFREINDNNVEPLSASESTWLESGNNKELQDRFVMLLRMKFDPKWKEP